MPNGKTEFLEFDTRSYKMFQIKTHARNLVFSSLFAMASSAIFSPIAVAQALADRSPDSESESAPIFIPRPADPKVRADNGDLPSENNGLMKAGEIDPVAVIPPAGKIPANLMSLSTHSYFSKYAFVYDKSTRTLTIWEKGENSVNLVKAVPADMGKVEGNKQILNDKKTPEGIYFFQQSLQGGGLNFNEYGAQAFTTDYPNFFDSLDQKTGNGIWLHAIPDTKSLRRGSRGCIVVRNEIVKTLQPYVSFYQTPIIVEDKVEYLDAKTLLAEQQKVLQWLEEWKASWMSKQIDPYIRHYDEKFSSGGMNLARWKTYKDRLTSNYDFIKVEIQNPTVYKFKNQILVRFLQKYESDKKSDFGEKTIYVYNRDGQLKIAGEFWRELSTDQSTQANTH